MNGIKIKMHPLLASYKTFVKRIIDPMIVSGAFIGGYSGMYMAHEDHPNNMAKIWFGGVVGAGVGTLTVLCDGWGTE